MPLVVAMHGNAHERGVAYGKAARDLIVECSRRWMADAGDRADELLVTLVDRSGFRATATRLAPALVAEVDGIAVGSGVDPRRVWALNLLDEDWWLRRRLDEDRGCSSLGVVPLPDH